MIISETVEQYFSHLIDLVNKMRLYGDKIEDKFVVAKILRTMPIKYDHVVASITESHDTDKMTIAELQGFVESHVDRIHEKSEKPIEEALKSQVTLSNIVETNQRGGSNIGRRRGRGSFRGRGRGNYSAYSPSQGKGGDNPKQDKFQFCCFNCEKFGHKIADCRYKKFNNHDNQANVVENKGEDSNESETLLLASNALTIDENTWFLDTGCSNHICGQKELFSELDESIQLEVIFGNNSRVCQLKMKYAGRYTEQK
ncbi:uncharacterized protein LOC127806341 [Diospyros lotus]|uniref:uncharacterized protein LOC127806341 n=1 Tax=Diospyros lotus TaxID=55363 RepID=UPI00224E374F|nr:uncharacterized protein LOC127806341 [Diospyros lotus]